MQSGQKDILKANSLLWIAAIIWGFAFVAQRVGMDTMGPFMFNGIRFLLGAISMIPLLFFIKHKPVQPQGKIKLWWAGVLAGIFIFGGSSLQQIGMVYTTAGNAGFITSLYVILVPILGVFLRHKIEFKVWIGASIATIGLYLLSVGGDFQVNKGDIFVFVSAFFWAGHVIIIGWLSPKVDIIKLVILQYLTNAILSLAAAFIFESNTVDGILQATIPILYGGLASVGIAYTLQVFGQRKARPSHAAIILSFESVFAVIGGWLILSETLGLRAIIGCMLMLSGIVLVQIRFRKKN